MAFSPEKPDHQRAGRSGTGGGGAETERFADYSGLRAGTGEKCLRSSGESERSPQRGMQPADRPGSGDCRGTVGAAGRAGNFREPQSFGKRKTKTGEGRTEDDR